MNVDALAFGA
jgi:hypothetical protein